MMESISKLYLFDDIEKRLKWAFECVIEKAEFHKFRRLAYSVDMYEELYKENNKTNYNKGDCRLKEMDFGLANFDNYIDHLKLMMDKIKEARSEKRENLTSFYVNSENELFCLLLKDFNVSIDQANELERKICEQKAGNDFKEKGEINRQAQFQ